MDGVNPASDPRFHRHTAIYMLMELGLAGSDWALFGKSDAGAFYVGRLQRLSIPLQSNDGTWRDFHEQNDTWSSPGALKSSDVIIQNRRSGELFCLTTFLKKRSFLGARKHYSN